MLTPNELLLTPNKLLLTPDEMAITKASVKKRSTMSKQSPYTKSVIKAGKTFPRHKQCTAKEVAHVAKSCVQSKKMPSKAARLDAKARARAWAKRELGQKKKGGQSQPRLRVPCAAASSRSVSANGAEDAEDQAKSESINKEMINALDRIGQSDNQFIVDDISEDVFYDAMEFPEEEETDIVVEDASDDDEEISNLRSSIRNQIPTKSWMEPVAILPK